MIDVTAIVVNWNTRDHLHNCLKSIYEQAGDVRFEVIVVDNASSDGSCEMVKNEFIEVKLISNNANRGYSAALNQGIRAGKGRYFLLLNSDVIICDKAIEKTVKYADGQNDAAAIGCQVFMGEGMPQPSFFMFPCVLNIFLETFGLSRMFRHNRFFGREWMMWSQWDEEREKERQVDVISGMFMLVRRKAIEEVGMMDESFFFLFEETDLCYRFSKAGWKIIYWPGAKIIHVHGGKQSRKKAGVSISLQHPKSMLIFFRKHHNLFDYLMVRTIMTVRGTLRFPVWGTLKLYRKLAGQDAQYQDEKMRFYWWSFWFCLLGLEPGKSVLKQLTGPLTKGIKVFIETTAALGFRAVSLLFRRSPEKVILYYHAMKSEDVAGFERQMKYLAKFSRIVKASQIINTPKDGTKPVAAVVFDDAFASFRDNALPVLRKYGLTASVAVPVGLMDKSPDWQMNEDSDDKYEIVLNDKSIAELDRQGFEIMSHTVSHKNLAKIGDDELKTELGDSKSKLEQILGHEVTSITYPYGSCNERVCGAAAQAGYKFGFSVEPQPVSQSTNPLCIGRFKVLPGESLMRFKLTVQGAYRAAGFLRRVKRMIIRK